MANNTGWKAGDKFGSKYNMNAIISIDEKQGIVFFCAASDYEDEFGIFMSDGDSEWDIQMMLLVDMPPSKKQLLEMTSAELVDILLKEREGR